MKIEGEDRSKKYEEDLHVSLILKNWDLGFLVSKFIIDNSNSCIVIYELIKYGLLTYISVFRDVPSKHFIGHLIKKLDTSTFL